MSYKSFVYFLRPHGLRKKGGNVNIQRTKKVVLDRLDLKLKDDLKLRINWEKSACSIMFRENNVNRQSRAFKASLSDTQPLHSLFVSLN